MEHAKPLCNILIVLINLENNLSGISSNFRDQNPNQIAKAIVVEIVKSLSIR